MRGVIVVDTRNTHIGCPLHSQACQGALAAHGARLALIELSPCRLRVHAFYSERHQWRKYAGPGCPAGARIVPPALVRHVAQREASQHARALQHHGAAAGALVQPRIRADKIITACPARRDSQRASRHRRRRAHAVRKQRVADNAGRLPRAQRLLRREREPCGQRRLAARDFAQRDVQRRPHGDKACMSYSAVAAAQSERRASSGLRLRHLANAE